MLDIKPTDYANLRIVQLLAGGSRPDLNEQAKFILAQDAFLTSDSETQKMKDRAILLASHPESVVIHGESGTGKELIAQILHGTRKGNFVAVNSTAVTETLFESELFGHMRGSFTGATNDRAGLIAHANDGTLFFDEIGDMPLSLQPKILRVLQTRKFRIVGSNIDNPVKCRVIAATHMNLPQLVKEGRFRLDLYHRLAQVKLEIKPLRERLSDLLLLVKNDELRDKILALATTLDAGTIFLPGNVRELENMEVNWRLFGEL